MQLFGKRIANLFCIKSIVTIALTAGFIVLALRGVFTGSEFLTIFTMVIGFYFGTQANKESPSDETKPNNE